MNLALNVTVSSASLQSIYLISNSSSKSQTHTQKEETLQMLFYYFFLLIFFLLSFIQIFFFCVDPNTVQWYKTLAWKQTNLVKSPFDEKTELIISSVSWNDNYHRGNWKTCFSDSYISCLFFLFTPIKSYTWGMYHIYETSAGECNQILLEFRKLECWYEMRKTKVVSNQYKKKKTFNKAFISHSQIMEWSLIFLE